MGKAVHDKVEEYIELWERRCYSDGIPDVAPDCIRDKVPDYRKIALALLNNDMQLTSLGYSGFQSDYYSILKRIEIDAREYQGKQMKINI